MTTIPFVFCSFCRRLPTDKWHQCDGPSTARLSVTAHDRTSHAALRNAGGPLYRKNGWPQFAPSGPTSYAAIDAGQASDLSNYVSGQVEFAIAQARLELAMQLTDWAEEHDGLGLWMHVDQERERFQREWDGICAAEEDEAWRPPGKSREGRRIRQLARRRRVAERKRQHAAEMSAHMQRFS